MDFDRETLRNYKICMINPDYTRSKFNTNKSMNVPSDATFLIGPSNDLNLTFDTAFVDKANIYDQINKIRKNDYDLYFNVCSGIVYDDVPGFEVITALEYYNLPYCGSDERFLNITKKEMKSKALRHGINTAKYWFVHTKEDIVLAAEHIKTYPMFIKHYNGCGSKGITKKSKVNNFQELLEQATLTIEEFGGALVEQFIEGREFTVLVIENHKDKYSPFVLDPIESIFHGNENFKHFDLKYGLNSEKPSTLQPLLDVEIKQKLIKAAGDSFAHMFGRSYARVDFRMNEQGELFFLEINPQPRIFYKYSARYLTDKNALIPAADYIILNDSSFKPQQVVEYLFYLGIVAFTRRQSLYYVSFADDRIYGKQGVFAAKNFQKGELVVNLEEKPRQIFSRQYVNKHFLDGDQKHEFINNAYQIGDELYGLLDESIPINHSCEPNMWFDEQTFNLYSRRLIQQGEQLTVDYATFVGDTGLKFECRCQSASCRKVFNHNDYQNEDMKKKYDGHFSPYLQKKILI